MKTTATVTLLLALFAAPLAAFAVQTTPAPSTVDANTYWFAQTTRILEGVQAGNFAPMLAALPNEQQARAAKDLPHLFATFAEGYGALEDFTILAAVPQAQGQTWVLAQLLYEGSTEVVRLVWHNGALQTIQRSGRPTTRAVAAARF